MGFATFRGKERFVGPGMTKYASNKSDTELEALKVDLEERFEGLSVVFERQSKTLAFVTISGPKPVFLKAMRILFPDPETGVIRGQGRLGGGVHVV